VSEGLADTSLFIAMDVARPRRLELLSDAQRVGDHDRRAARRGVGSIRSGDA
jgi:hypothetical protein